MQKSLIINSVGNVGTNTGKKYQKAIAKVNPDVSNEKAGTFATMANALTTNVYGNAQIVKKMDVSEEDTVKPSVDLNNYTGSSFPLLSYPNEGTTRIAFGNDGYIDVTY